MKNSLPEKKSKIVCTIGPASSSITVLEQMIHNGMDIARINFAHGDFESHKMIIANIRAAAKNTRKRVSILGDLPGPKIRIGRLREEVVSIEKGQSIVLQTEKILGTAERVSVNFAGLPGVLKPDDSIFINDGFIKLSVESVDKNEVHCEVIVGGELRSYKGVNFPGIDLGISAFTQRDQVCLEFASEQSIDAVSQSFVQDAADIEAVRSAAKEMDYDPFIVAKMERASAVENLDAILENADGIMVARGDLGVEIPIREIAIVQKRMIRSANLLGKPVITATHMLESMIDHSRPTRAEATDVANAILDGTDCLMLSGETAVGDFPVESVAMMADIARTTEPYAHIGDVAQLLQAAKTEGAISTQDLISLSIYMSVDSLDPVAVLTPTMSGDTARRVGRYHLPVWIISVSPSDQICQKLQFSYGVFPIFESVRPISWEQYACDCLENFGLANGLVILTMGSSRGDTGTTNHIEIIDLADPPTANVVW